MAWSKGRLKEEFAKFGIIGNFENYVSNPKHDIEIAKIHFQKMRRMMYNHPKDELVNRVSRENENNAVFVHSGSCKAIAGTKYVSELRIHH